MFCLLYFYLVVSIQRTKKRGKYYLMIKIYLAGTPTLDLNGYKPVIPSLKSRGSRRLKHRPQKYFFSGKRRSTTSDPSFRGAMGGISTTQEYENDHLKLNFKWGQTKYRPKENNKRHSGLLYHAVGNHGADGGFWMRS